MPSFLRRLGNLSGTLLNDQLERQRAAYTSNLERQRQEEVARQGAADRLVTGLAPKLTAGDIAPEDIQGFDNFPTELQTNLRALASGAPSKQQRGDATVAPIMQKIAEMGNGADASTLPDEDAVVAQSRNAMAAKGINPESLYGVNDPALKVRQAMVGQEAQASRNMDAADTRKYGQEQDAYNIAHPDKRPGINIIGMSGQPQSYVLDAKTGKMRLVNPNEDTSDVEWKDASQPSTGNDRPYFTLQPVYDKSGRPIGAVKMEGRTGKTEYIGADKIGGELKGPPGNLGEQTITNESSLDALDNIKDMFDKGAKNLVGPVEGRLRVLGQQIPGVPTNDDFANFDAASSAFKNSVIKAITGAQMSEQEATRILQQVPLVSDKADVWKAKETQTRKNLKFLEARTKAPRTDMGGATNSNVDANDPAGLFK